MTAASYEIISLKDGRWITETVTDSREEALQRADEILNSGYFLAVKVLEERLDESTGETQTSLIFNKKKTMGMEKALYTGPERRTGTEWRDDPKGYLKKVKQGQKQRRKRSFFKEIIIAVVVTGMAFLLVIFFALWYISAFTK